MKQLIHLDYHGFEVMADNNAWFNATQMAQIFNKKVIEYLRLPKTIELVDAICQIHNVGKSHLIKTKQGKNGGTWLNKDLAIDFAQWLDVHFRIWCISQIEAIISNGQNWQDSRAESKLGYQIMSEILKSTRDANGKDTKPFHYSNEALLCNWALTGQWKSLKRNALAKQDLNLLVRLEANNAAYIAQGLSHDRRKEKLRELVLNKRVGLVSNTNGLGALA